MNYWKMQLHPNDTKSFDKENTKYILGKGIIGCAESWENDRGRPEAFKNEIKKEDIVLIHTKGFLGLVRVLRDEYRNPTPNEKEDKLLWFDIVRDVEVLEIREGEDCEILKNEFKEKTKIEDWREKMFMPVTIDGGNEDYSPFIKFWHQKILKKNNMENIKKLLEHKKQIILQGPPGTGKTYTAEKIANELTGKGKSILKKPLEIVTDFFKNYVETDEIIKERNRLENLRKKFVEDYPIETLKDLTLEDYCIGNGNRGFCYRLEYELNDLCQYTGYANKFGIYYNQKKEKYLNRDYSEFNGKDEKEIMKVITEWMSKILTKRKPNDFMGHGLQAKLLNTYYPEEFFPILNSKHINNALEIIERKAKGSFFERSNMLMTFFNEHKKLGMTAYEFMKFLYGNFDMTKFVGGTLHESDFGKEGISKGKSKLIQFHPAYSYEDFVRGIVAKTEDNQVSYQTQNKVLAQFAEEARQPENENKNFVLIIDEINRANLPAVLGELIYALEYRDKPVESMYNIDEEIEGDTDAGRQIILPENLYIIGTMNTADRSVGHIDYAIRRRFAFWEMLPKEEIIESDAGKRLFRDVAKLFKKEINSENSENADFLSNEFKWNDVQIGHSYFMVNKKKDDKELTPQEEQEQLKMKLEYEVKPILREYLKDGVLLENAKEEIERLNIE